MSHSKILGMIPGFKPPEGTVKAPKGFTHLPSHKEVVESIRDWLKARGGMDPYLESLRQNVADEEQLESIRGYNRTWGGEEV